MLNGHNQKAQDSFSLISNGNNKYSMIGGSSEESGNPASSPSREKFMQNHRKLHHMKMNNFLFNEEGETSMKANGANNNNSNSNGNGAAGNKINNV